MLETDLPFGFTIFAEKYLGLRIADTAALAIKPLTSSSNHRFQTCMRSRERKNNWQGVE